MENIIYEKTIQSDISEVGSVVASVSKSVNKSRATSIVRAITHFFYGHNKGYSAYSPAGAIFNSYNRSAKEVVWLCKLLIAQLIFETRWMESEQWARTNTAGVIARPGVTVEQWLSIKTIGSLFSRQEVEDWFTGNKIKVYKNFYFEAASKQVGIKILAAYLTHMRTDYGSTVKRRMSSAERTAVIKLEDKAKQGVNASSLSQGEFRTLVRTNAMRWQSGEDPQSYLRKIESIAANNIKIAII